MSRIGGFDAGTEEHGKDTAEFAVPKRNGEDPAVQVRGCVAAVDGGVHVGGEGETEGCDIQQQNAQEGEAAEGVNGGDAVGLANWLDVIHGALLSIRFAAEARVVSQGIPAFQGRG